MKCVIGIDGGGTKSRLCMVDMERETVYEVTGGGVNLCSMDSRQVKENLEQIVEMAVLAVPAVRIISICLGAAGIIDDGNVAYFKEILRPYAEHIQVFNDAHIAMYANLKYESGIVLTAGTGSILYGRNQEGKVLRVGGWGHLMGDEGSGYRIGLQALNIIARNHDLRKRDSILTHLFLEHFQCVDFQNLVCCIYNRVQDKKQIASLAGMVDRAAESGDEDAVGILKQCAGQLCEMCGILVEQLGLAGTPFSIVANGSILQKSRTVMETFKSLMQQRYPNSIMKSTLVDPVWGAIDIALGHAGQEC